MIRQLLKEQIEPSNGVYYCLPREMGEIKEVEKETYNHRSQLFDHAEALKLGRPEFTRCLRDKGTAGTVFLEVAGGSGNHALHMMKDGYKIIESDISEGSVRRVKEFAENMGVHNNAYFCVADAENLPFKSESLDGIFMTASLHHFPNPQKAMAEFHRCLKKSGVLLVGYEPASWQYYLFYPFLLALRSIIRKRNKGRPVSIADDETFGFSKRKLNKMFKKARFNDIKITPVYYLYKTYKNYRILVSKLKRKPYKESEKVKKHFINIDSKIAKIPVIRGLTWDWDAIGYKYE